ncbi:hypothetical protein [Ornithinimicrobium kibberense]|uniref:hypothetical protein n=1 Tax=Ornithinimicrobium kibberense TaxID=282060 RepID=UPI003610C8E6
MPVVPLACGMLNAVLALPWGSMSTTRTRRPASAMAAAMFTAVVVLPTPPFWLATVITLVPAHGRGRSAGPSLDGGIGGTRLERTGTSPGAGSGPGPAAPTPFTSVDVSRETAPSSVVVSRETSSAGAVGGRTWSGSPPWTASPVAVRGQPNRVCSSKSDAQVGSSQVFRTGCRGHPRASP